MINSHSLKKIDKIIKSIYKDFSIVEFPVKMPSFLKANYKSKIIIRTVKIEGDADVICNYDKNHDIAAIIINKNRSIPSLYKRLNFSLAHEYAHLMLKHYLIYDFSKEYREELEEEANEFAARFLIPAEQFLNHYCALSDKELSDYFFVSTQVIQNRYKNYINYENIERERRKFDNLLNSYLYSIES